MLAVILPYFALMLGSFMSFLTANIRPSVFTLENYATILVGDNLTPVLNSLLLSAGGGLGLYRAETRPCHLSNHDHSHLS